jgi:quercetin dioxygenase-like cupin family protein
VPIYTTAEAESFEAHGSHFFSYVRSSRGATALCAWRLEVQPNMCGVAHRPSHEEVILLLEGSLRIRLEGATREVKAGDVVHVPADAELKVDGGPGGAKAWVTTSAGMQALIGDSERMSPPWAQ